MSTYDPTSKLLQSFEPFQFASIKHLITSFLEVPDLTQPKNIPDNEIHLYDIASGWGNAAHPTTKLCIDFIEDCVKPGMKILDYGTGSGILSVLAGKQGASSILAIDIDEDALNAARLNAEVNGLKDITRVLHTREIYLGDDSIPLSDITVANIQPGPLSRLVAPLWLLTKPGGTLCLSGMRPHELSDIQRIFKPYVETDNEKVDMAEHEIYGQWVSWVVRTKVMSDEERKERISYFNELSIS